jgi:hypothetical protein
MRKMCWKVLTSREGDAQIKHVTTCLCIDVGGRDNSLSRLVQTLCNTSSTFSTSDQQTKESLRGTLSKSNAPKLRLRMRPQDDRLE